MSELTCLLKGVALSALFFFLAAGCSRSPDGWVCKVEPTCSFAICCLPAINPLKEVELELEKSDAIRIYVNVHGCPLYTSDDDSIPVTVAIGENTSTFTAYVLAGEQRLLLPIDATDVILEALCRHDEVKISVGRYKTAIRYDNFDEEYDKFCNG